MIVVTGGAGFIGSNLVHALNARGRTDILVVDNLSDGRKFENLAGAILTDYLDHETFRRMLDVRSPWLADVETLFHLGACSDTTEWDGRYMLDNNFQVSREILDACEAFGTPLVYACTISERVMSSESARALASFSSSVIRRPLPTQVHRRHHRPVRRADTSPASRNTDTRAGSVGPRPHRA